MVIDMIQIQKMSHKQRKALLRKEKRRAKRQAEAQQKPPDKEASVSESEDEAALLAAEVEKHKQHELWLEREKIAQEEWLAKKEREKREAQRKLEMEQQIREEWEERQKREKEEEEEREKREQERKEKQDELLKQATANENKDAWHNPLAPARFGRERDECPFFMKTGACRFAERCSRTHTMPESSCTLMFPGMFANFRLQQSLVEENDTDDLALECDDNEMYQQFSEFYHDVLPEFRRAGRIVQFKVSSNCEPHLRGNVYVQYKNEESAHKAFMTFNGRWYGGKQLSGVFVNIPKWKSAICGLAFTRRCPKGKSCNFLHVFRNPCNEFWQADKDIDPSERRQDHRNSDYRDSRHRYGSERRDRPSVNRDRGDKYDHKYSRSNNDRSRSRSRSPDSRWKRRKRSRSHSRSPYSRSESRRRSRSPSSRSRKRNKSCSRSRSPKSRSRVRSRSRSRSHSRYRSEHKSGSRSTSKARRKRSKSRSRSRSVTQFERSRSPSIEKILSANNDPVGSYSNGTGKAKDSDNTSDSDSDRSKSKHSPSNKRKKAKKAKKHKHKHKSKKTKKKTRYGSPVKSDTEAYPKNDIYPNIMEIPPDNSDGHPNIMEIAPDNSDGHPNIMEIPPDISDGHPNIIEIPPDDSDDDMGDVIFEDVYV